MLFQEEKQSNSGAVDLVNLTQTVTAAFSDAQLATEDAKEAFVWDSGFPDRKTVFWLTVLSNETPKHMSSGTLCEVQGLEKTQVLRVHLAPQVCLPAYSPHCPNTKTACSTPVKHYGSGPDGAARESHIHLFWMSLTNVLWEGINNLTYYWIFCFYSAV